MIDASELPAMPSPLLKHVMGGLDKRLKQPVQSSFIHNIRPAARPVELPPPPPASIGTNDVLFRAGIMELAKPGAFGLELAGPVGIGMDSAQSGGFGIESAHTSGFDMHSTGYDNRHEYTRNPFESWYGQSSVSNDYRVNGDGLVQLNIVNSDFSGNRINGDGSGRLSAQADENSLNKLYIPTTTTKPDLNPLTVKPDLQGSNKIHVNTDYNGVSVRHLVESIAGMREMHVNPDPIFERVDHDNPYSGPDQHHEFLRENMLEATKQITEGSESASPYGPSFSFPGSEQLWYEKKYNIGSVQKRFADPEPEANSEIQPPMFTKIQPALFTRDIDTIHSQNQEVQDENSKQNENLSSIPHGTQNTDLNSLTPSREFLSVPETEEENVEPTEKIPSSVEQPEHDSFVENTGKESIIAATFDKTISGGEDEFLNPEKRSSVDSEPIETAEPEIISENKQKSDNEFSSDASKSSRRTSGDNNNFAMFPLDEIRLQTGLQQIVDYLKNDPEVVPAHHINHVLLPSTMSYKQEPGKYSTGNVGAASGTKNMQKTDGNSGVSSEQQMMDENNTTQGKPNITDPCK